MIFDSRFFPGSTAKYIGDCVYIYIYIYKRRIRTRNGRGTERNIERGSFCPALVSSYSSFFPSPPLYLFTLSFRLCLSYLDRSFVVKFIVSTVNPSTGSGIYSTSAAAPALLPRRGGLHLPRIKPVLLPPETGIMTLESVQRTNECGSRERVICCVFSAKNAITGFLVSRIYLTKFVNVARLSKRAFTYVHPCETKVGNLLYRSSASCENVPFQ